MEGLRNRMRRAGVSGVAALGWMAVAGGALAQWEAPEAERQTPNPVERTAASVEIGHKLYRENCETCHGTGGMGDGPGARVLEARLPNFQDAAWAETRTDGEWFYKISVGKDPMVGYEDFLEVEEIWHSVNYMRSLSAGEASPSATAIGAVGGSVVAQAVETPAQVEAATEAMDEAVTEAADGEVPVEEAEAGHAPDMHAEEAHADEAHADEAHAEEAHADGAHDDEAHGAAVAHDDHGGHGGGSHAPAAIEFDPRGISNYNPTHAKAPLVWALILPILIGAIFVAFQKMVPPPPGSPAPTGGGHGHDDGHGHGHH